MLDFGYWGQKDSTLPSEGQEKDYAPRSVNASSWLLKEKEASLLKCGAVPFRPDV